jgi:hypothetical protein
MANAHRLSGRRTAMPRRARPQWRQVRELILQEADDMAAVSRRVVLAVLKDAKLDVDSLYLPPGYLDT